MTTETLTIARTNLVEDWEPWARQVNVLLACIQRMAPTGDKALTAAIKAAVMTADTLAGDLQSAAEGNYDAGMPA